MRVLADVAEKADEIDVERARRALERAQEQVINPALGRGPGGGAGGDRSAPQARLDAAAHK